MNSKAKTLLSILTATLWISISEFARNELVFKSYWTGHYSGLGLDFPDEPLNGAVWGLWSLLYAVFLWILLRRFSLLESIATGWFAGFVLMWIVTGNMGVLPFSLLWFAVPLSMLEAAVGCYLISRIDPPPKRS